MKLVNFFACVVIIVGIWTVISALNVSGAMEKCQERFSRDTCIHSLR